MIILGIETSCDETALALLEAEGGLEKPRLKVLAHNIRSQIAIHEKYGGVFPMMAKREHAKALTPLLEKTLEDAKIVTKDFARIAPQQSAKSAGADINTNNLKKILEKEQGLFEDLSKFLETTEIPNIDAIAVTYGPGLEPALWVGISFARALGIAWNIPVIPTNHMEGHIVSAGIDVEFPALALLISGGHTELVLAEEWTKYKVVGKTRDDAVGEAFDKVARMLALPYPGGPEMSKLAEKERTELTSAEDPRISPLRGPDHSSVASSLRLPRPMLHSHDLDFSFSGLKTAVLYMLKKIPDITPKIKQQIACEFEDTVVEVLVTKTEKAILEYSPKTLIVGGGVIANKTIRNAFETLAKKYPDTKLLVPERNLATDNALMIATAGYVQICKDPSVLTKRGEIVANGNLAL